MSRIISGLAGSIKLKAAAKSTRPTSDRVKESLFAQLEHLGVLEGAKVLDLYAGSGALGLEAASRGASEVVFIEIDKGAYAVLTQNIEIVSRAPRLKTRLSAYRKDCQTVAGNLADLYDLVFVDPPYSVENSGLSALVEALWGNLKDKGLVVIERSRKSGPIIAPAGGKILSTREYGDTVIEIIGKE